MNLLSLGGVQSSTLLLMASQQVQQWIGISPDEVHRMRQVHVSYIRLVYPLLELGMRRSDCLPSRE